ncbi:hypothetical protein D187_002193 [Cystobacter fuscus DSM 2262]|uniref:Uncharacterized protein n=1 Tax=Cystobacter fuscus (strain ATCC 25194 / DSM 2262 / NBRC 100088 / M29) TaxID=1242864 RepID=S9PCX1_CYSF2|nr:hypothetical protein D187_002193 [Cystobacter fuscus DSM 2262]
MARDVRLPARPQEAARRLFEVEARSGSYTYEPPSRRITPLEPGEHLEGQSTMAEVELTRDYLRWCERTGRPGDCLRLLTESPTLNGDGRFALALALAKGAVLDEMLEAFKDMADPHAMVAAVLWTWTTYMVLVSLPDVTVSKGLAAVMTATIISYVGVETFWGLVVGFKRLMDEADRATTFNGLRAAGERYGKLMGRNAARAFAMLAMAAMGNTAPGLAAKVPKLPGSMQAAVQAETQVGIRLAAVGEVETVAVSAETVTIALAPGAVAMTSSRTSGDGAPKKDDLPELERWHEGSYDSPLDSLQKHFAKHGAEVGAKDVSQYLRKARGFAQNIKGAQKFPIEGATEGVIRYVKSGKYIDLAPDGRIVSFGAR